MNTKPLRPRPDDFAEVAPTASIRDMRVRYITSSRTIKRWLCEAGISKSAVDRVPADFIERAKTSSRAELIRHYQISDGRYRSWVKYTGVTPPLGTTGFRMPMPADFTDVAPTMTISAMTRHYGVARETVSRWLAETGLKQAAFVPPPPPKRLPAHWKSPNQRNLAGIRNYGVHDEAADVLRRFGPVYRCDERGRAGEKGKFWRVGNVVVDGDALLARAERAKRKAA